MFKHELFEILSTFSEEDLNRFERFLLSPYFNTSKRISKLFAVIRKSYPHFSDQSLSKETLYKHISPNRNYNDSTIRSLLWILEDLAKMYLRVEKSLESEVDNSLLKIYSEKKLYHLFESEFEKCKVNLQKVRQTEKFDFYKEFLIEVERFNHLTVNGKLTRKSLADQKYESLHGILINLFNLFLTEFVNVSMHAIEFSETLHVKSDLILINDIHKTINFPKLLRVIQKDNPSDFILDLYFALYKMFVSKSNIKNYHRYKSLLKKSIPSLNPDEISFHYSKLISYCMTKAYSISEFKTELFSLFKELIENHYYITKKEKYLRPPLFRSILLTGLMVKQFKWCQNFIKNSPQFLHDADKENMKNFGYAYFYFEMEDFKKTLAYLNKFDVDYFIYLYDIKNLTVKSFYELGYYEEALSYIKSYKKFLRKNLLVSDIRRVRHIAFISFVEKIILKSNKGNKELDFLKHLVNEADNVSYKDWLIQKINKLLKHSDKAV